jgi:hypothetical protein
MIVTAVMSLVWAGVAAGQIARQIPSNALVVLKVSKLQATSAKVGQLAQELGLAQLQPQIADPLGSMEAELKLTRGINRDGDLAICYIDPAAADGADESFVVLIPVSNYQEFVTNFGEPVVEGDVTRASLPDTEQPAFLAQWGDYAAMSPIQALVSKKPEGLALAGLAATEFDSKDAVLFANMPALRDKAIPVIQQNRPEILENVQQAISNVPGMDQRFAPVLRAAADQMMTIAEGFMRDSQAALLGVSIGNEGISTTLVSEFAPNTYASRALGQIKNTNQSLLAGLPDARYWALFGMMNTPEVTAKLVDDALAPILKELANIPDAAKPINDYMTAMKTSVSAMNAQSAGLIAPTAALGQGSLVQGVCVYQGDAAALAGAQRQMFTAQMELTKLIAPNAPQQMTYTPGAKTVGGVNFDQIQSTFVPQGNDPAQMQMAQMMTMMYGPDGMVAYTGSIGADQLLMVFGLTDPQIQQAIDAAKARQAMVANQGPMASVAGKLPNNRAAEMYVAIDVIVSTVSNYARQFGMPVQIQLPPDLPPVGATVATEGNAVRIDGYIPTTLIQSLIAAGMQAAMQMQGGGMGGGPGGL